MDHKEGDGGTTVLPLQESLGDWMPGNWNLNRWEISILFLDFPLSIFTDSIGIVTNPRSVASFGDIMGQGCTEVSTYTG